MKLIYYLYEKFIEEEKYNLICIIIFSLLFSILSTNIISNITAIIIENIQSGSFADVQKYYKIFIGVAILSFIIYYIYKYFQNIFLSKFPEWIKREIIHVILNINNVNMSNVNFINFYNNIIRISSAGYGVFDSMIDTYIPSLSFILVIMIYLMYNNWILGITFLFFNILIIGYLCYFTNNIILQKTNQKDKVSELNKYILDLFNNIEKVIYRGQTKKEINELEEKTKTAIEYTYSYNYDSNNHIFIANALSYMNVFVILGYMIHLQSNKKLSTVTFITFFTIILLYRDRVNDIIRDLPYNIESMATIINMIPDFDFALIGEMSIKNVLEKINDTKYVDQELSFDKITFENVFFKYGGTDKMILQDFSQEIYLKNQIIGIVGESGKGKSSIMKLVLRLYEPNSGHIYIDDVDISTLDPYYIRKHITYVNQNSRLFDKKVIENIFYACNHEESCDAHLKQIMEYPKIKELFKNIDIINDDSGSLGENLSGGQRQTINIISGLINPTDILILDEPTNGLDKSLKLDIISIINDFKSYKKCIIIITHDHDVFPIFEQKITL